MTLPEIASLLNVAPQTVKNWRRCGLLRGVLFNDKNQCLYPHRSNNAPSKRQGTKLSERRQFPEVRPNRNDEVQCEA